MSYNERNVENASGFISLLGFVILFVCITVIWMHYLDLHHHEASLRTKERVALIDACKTNPPPQVGECIRVAQGFNK